MGQHDISIVAQRFPMVHRQEEFHRATSGFKVTCICNSASGDCRVRATNCGNAQLHRAVLIETVFPVGVTDELLHAVTDEMGVDLVSAMGKAAVARGFDPSKVGAPEEKITEVHRIVR
jgi:hypothetical protein